MILAEKEGFEPSPYTFQTSPDHFTPLKINDLKTKPVWGWSQMVCGLHHFYTIWGELLLNYRPQQAAKIIDKSTKDFKSSNLPKKINYLLFFLKQTATFPPLYLSTTYKTLNKFCYKFLPGK